METYRAQVMELISLGPAAGGRAQIELAVTEEDRREVCHLDIDEFTYRGLKSLQLLSGGRARLSPYIKSDLYGKDIYGTIIQTSSGLRETLRFSCSENFRTQIESIKARPIPRDPVEEDKSTPTAPSQVERLPALVSRASQLVLGMACMLAALCIPSAGQIGSEHFLHLPIVAAQEAGLAEVAGPMLAQAAGSLIPIVKAASAAQPAVPAKTAVQEAPQAYEVVSISREGKKFFGLPKDSVALTFDDGPSSFTRTIVDMLAERQVAATFLFVGQNAQRHPEAVTYASRHGMSIGSHSWSHRLLTQVDGEDQLRDLSRTNKVLEALTKAPVTLFRPPYGAFDDGLDAAAEQLGMTTLLWNRDPEDWKAENSEAILRYFQKIDAAGGVYVLHEDKNTVAALPAILDYLEERKMKFAVFK